LLDELDNDRDHEASEQAEMSASRAKILLQETVENFINLSNWKEEA